MTTGVAALCMACGGGAGEADSSEPKPSAAASSPSEPTTTPSPTATESASPSTPATPALPDCAKTWVAGKRLPLRYQGCIDGSGRVVPDRGVRCVVGHELVVFRNQYYAVATGKISKVPDVRNDPGYALTKDLCKNGTPSG